MTDNKDRILSILCLVCGVAAYPLVCRWYLGVMAAVAAIVIFIYHGMHYERNRLTTTVRVRTRERICFTVRFILIILVSK